MKVYNSFLFWWLSTSIGKKNKFGHFGCCAADSQTDTGRHQLYNLLVFFHWMLWLSKASYPSFTLLPYCNTLNLAPGDHRRGGVQGERAHHLQRHHDQRCPQHGLHHRLHQRLLVSNSVTLILAWKCPRVNLNGYMYMWSIGAPENWPNLVQNWSNSIEFSTRTLKADVASLFFTKLLNYMKDNNVAKVRRLILVVIKGVSSCFST